MRSTIYLAIAALCLCGAYSCRQFIYPPHGGHHGGDSTISINLTYPNPDTTDYGSTFELIISEPGGRILLDTLAPYNAQIIAKMTTSKPLLDVATVIYSPTFNFYGMNVNKSVQPATWMVIPNNPLPLPFPNAIPGTITYTNAPQVDFNTVHFSSLPTTSTDQPSIADYANGQLDISYSGFSGNNLAYLILPTLGQYSYQPIHAVNDTISLSRMDSTVKVFFSMPSPYSLAASDMWGYLDTTDFTKYLLLYSYYQSLPQGDLQYPPKGGVPAQKYAVDVEATSQNGEFLVYRTFGAIPPTGTLSVPFPATPIYTLNSTANDSFSVSFAQRPTNYTTNWSAGNINVSITASPDSMLIRALPLASSLQSKLLQGKSLTGLALQNFGYETVAGQTYASYYTHQTNPQQLVQNPFASDLLYDIFLQ
ncbi:MAG TPA: hypothetical protein VMH27_04460 [Puia sp.]|nr:hypothetical protein [Puia sp.]